MRAQGIPNVVPSLVYARGMEIPGGAAGGQLRGRSFVYDPEGQAVPVPLIEGSAWDIVIM